MNRFVAALKSYLAYFKLILHRRSKAAADRKEDPFIYPHS